MVLAAVPYPSEATSSSRMAFALRAKTPQNPDLDSLSVDPSSIEPNPCILRESKQNPIHKIITSNRIRIAEGRPMRSKRITSFPKFPFLIIVQTNQSFKQKQNGSQNDKDDCNG